MKRRSLYQRKRSAFAAAMGIIIGEIRRLNAVGLGGVQNRSRSEQAAIVRKELAERYKTHARCC
jgi:hypothetical protein